MSESGTRQSASRTPERSWYVARTKSRQEEQVALVLTQRGVAVYLPRVSVVPGERKGGNVIPRISPRLEPLFPGYLFVRMDASSPEWVMARSAPGVAYFLGCQGHPSPVPDELVEDVRSRAELQQKRGWVPCFQAGDRVVITTGPLAGLVAVFDGALSPSGRSRVLVQVLSRLVPVVVSAELLRRAG